MRSPEGKDYWSTGVYREIVPLERIVCTDSFADEKGNVVPATHYGMDSDIPLEMLVTVTFEEHEGKTKLTLRHVGIPSGAEHDSCEAGWTQSLDRLAEHLAKSLRQPQTSSAQAAGGRLTIRSSGPGPRSRPRPLSCASHSLFACRTLFPGYIISLSISNPPQPPSPYPLPPGERENIMK